MKKKILSILLTVAMLAAMIPAFGVVAFADNGTEPDWEATTVVLDTSAEVMDFFATQLKTKDFAGQTVELHCDVDFNSDSDTFGDRQACKAFAGTFDGKGHILSNFAIYSAGGACGLFGKGAPTSAPTIKNVAFINCTVVSKAWQSGLLYGCDTTTVINVENVYVKNLTHSQIHATNSCYGGGLVGYAALNCTNVVVTSYEQAHEIKTNFGGFAAQTKAASTFTNCAFYGKLTLAQSAGFVCEKANNVTLNDCISIVESGSSSMRPYAYGGQNNVSPSVAEGGAVLTMTGFGGDRNTAITGIKNYDTSAYIGVGAQAILDENGMDGWTATTTGYPMPVSLVKTFPTLFENEVAETPMTLHGYQTTKAIENKFDMRLVATIATEDLSQYKNIGFQVVANYGDPNTSKATAISSTVVYTSVSANGEGGAKEYSVADLLGENATGYIFALAITGVPADQGDITFEVTTFYTDANDNVVNGNTEVFTVDVDSIAIELPNV